MEPKDVIAASQFLAKHADSVSQNGFLPRHLPLRRLPDQRYSAWEAIASNLPTLLLTGRIRHAVFECPIESTRGLRSEGEWRWAYVLLTYMSHAYIWGGDQPAEILPPQLSIPLLRVSLHLALPPVLTCAAANLWNFTSTDACSFSSPASLTPLVSFTASPTESWFLMVGVAVESLGGAIVQTILSAVRAAIARDFLAVAAALLQLSSRLEEITAVMARLPEQCDPPTFYHEVRPFYAGTKNMAGAGLPRAVLYDTGDENGEWKQLRGGSNGQSSLFPLIDSALGVQHTTATATNKSRRRGGDDDGTEDDYHADILNYIPREHRSFLTDFAQIWNIHDVIATTEDLAASEALRAAHAHAGAIPQPALTNCDALHHHTIEKVDAASWDCARSTKAKPGYVAHHERRAHADRDVWDAAHAVLEGG
ncbi:hypothetical protein LLEC1_01084 [Akanthomyces lecanii]|uniref:Indoleamine 2,3-dioxygenase n=1 Tax=Cordyceps confragosa TaxID=2714763 RepID=A0A179IBN5_CORDF|nr:hypothetical protein LLEC1_01084 [Akanthomyces lecanii]